MSPKFARVRGFLQLDGRVTPAPRRVYYAPTLEGRGLPAGYRMIESFSARNFRCFERVDLDDLKRVNVVVGANATGKTALGEALYLSAMASPVANYWFRNIRNRLLPQQQPLWDRNTFERFWSDLFYDFDPKRGTELTFIDSEKNHYKIQVFYRETDAPRQTLAGPLPSIPAIPLVFKRIGPKGTSESRAFLENNIPQFDGTIELIPQMFALPATGQFTQGDIAGWFDNLNKKGEAGDVLKYLRQIFPLIEGLDIGLDATLAALYAKVKSVRELLPIGVVSAGVSKVLGILLAIANSNKGVVLVDEIDNGIHYKKLSTLWTTLFEFCEDRETQLFAATHSWEALKAISGVLGKNVDKFSYLRTERDEGKCVVYHFDGQTLKDTLDENIDPRGGEE